MVHLLLMPLFVLDKVPPSDSSLRYGGSCGQVRVGGDHVRVWGSCEGREGVEIMGG